VAKLSLKLSALCKLQSIFSF